VRPAEHGLLLRGPDERHPVVGRDVGRRRRAVELVLVVAYDDDDRVADDIDLGVRSLAEIDDDGFAVVLAVGDRDVLALGGRGPEPVGGARANGSAVSPLSTLPAPETARPSQRS
jgi:hypothetical protein